MRLCNETITVFNARVDPETGGRVWTPTVINGAGWYATDASAVDVARGGLITADRIVIRIPEGADAGGKAFVDPTVYASVESVAGLWTLQNGDVIVKGEVTGTEWTPAALRRSFADCATVLSVTDNRRAPNAKHWRVVGA